MTAYPLPSPLFHVTDPDDGTPLALGKVHTYVAGTTTGKTTWADSGKVSSNTNPVILDANGDAPIYIDGLYKIRVERADGSLVYEMDYVASLGIFGYRAGEGGAVVQATSKSTGVTLNRATGQITMNNAALGAGAEVSFTLTDNLIGPDDILVFNHSLSGKYVINAVCGSGSAAITVRNVTAGSLSEALVIKYAQIKAAST